MSIAMLNQGRRFRAGNLSTFSGTLGDGGAYRVGQQISFIHNFEQSGALTMVNINPANAWNIFEVGISINGINGASNSLTETVDGRSKGIVYLVEPPRGTHRLLGFAYTGAPLTAGDFSSTSGTFSDVNQGIRELKYEILNALKGRNAVSFGESTFFVR